MSDKESFCRSLGLGATRISLAARKISVIARGEKKDGR